MRPRWQRTARREAETVDVTAFLSLMVILVPFLLVTAVFSRMTVLELQSASGKGSEAVAQDQLNLEVVLRQTTIEVSYNGLTQTNHIDRSTDERAMATLAELTSRLKSLHPQSQIATVLVEPSIPYHLLVQVLDILRMKPGAGDNNDETEFLFPLISIGSAATIEPNGVSTP